MSAGSTSSMLPPEGGEPALFQPGWLLRASERCTADELLARSEQRVAGLSALAREDAIAAGLLAKLWLASASAHLIVLDAQPQQAWALIEAALSALVVHVEESAAQSEAAERFVSLCFELDALAQQIDLASREAPDEPSTTRAIRTARFASRAFWVVSAAGLLLVLRLPAMRSERAFLLLTGLSLAVMVLFLVNARAVRTVALRASVGGRALPKLIAQLDAFEQDELRGGFLRDLLRAHPALSR